MFLPAALKLLSPKLIVQIIDYVTKDNDLDLKMRATIEQVASNKEAIEELKKNSHAPRDFVVCESCKKEIVNG